VLIDQGLLHRLAKMPVVLAQVLVGNDAQRRIHDVLFGGDGAQVVADPAPVTTLLLGVSLKD
jgi:glucose/arabinose dehydrogenase